MSYVANSNISPMNEDPASFYLWYADSATTSNLSTVPIRIVRQSQVTDTPDDAEIGPCHWSLLSLPAVT
jgi:hypothetical protein